MAQNPLQTILGLEFRNFKFLKFFCKNLENFEIFAKFEALQEIF